jgi:Right handed beta helix region
MFTRTKLGVSSGLVLALAAGLASLGGCGSKGGTMTGGQAGNPGTVGGPPNMGPMGVFPPNGTHLPWPVFDGTIPDTPEAVSPGRTFYADPIHGDDTHDGMTFATAKKTIQASITKVGLKAGDTLLLGGGIYREYPKWYDGPTGTKDAPVTIGSYGRGTGAPILDGGSVPNTWTKYTGGGATTVWQSSTMGLAHITTDNPVLGIYVDNGTDEFALREVLHGQVKPYIKEPVPPNRTGADIKDNSNDWYFDPAAQILYADFGGTLGDKDPNAADISILHKTHSTMRGSQLVFVLGHGHGYFHIIGLTIRAASWSGVYTETSGNTFDHCDVKFNGGGGIQIQPDTAVKMPETDSAITNSRVWMNVLDNWPRFNNDYTGGGWPAAIGCGDQSNLTLKGNVVYLNGGEGLALGGTHFTGFTSVNNQVINNLVWDNFSVNMYIDNTVGATLVQNFIFQHPRDETQTFALLFDVSPGFKNDFGKRIAPQNLNLGDEPGSSYDNAAHLANITVINNIIAGGQFALDDYDDGTKGIRHGLRNTVIENNTFVLVDGMSVQTPYGWRHTSTTDTSMNSLFKNNLFVTAIAKQHFVEVGKTDGIDVDYNLYSGPGSFDDQSMNIAFPAWQAAHPTWDVHSLAADAMLGDLTEFTKPATMALVYDWSKAAPSAGSPAFGGGAALGVMTDFTGTARASGSKDIGAVAPK